MNDGASADRDRDVAQHLAGGVTTMRTTGSVETYADLNLRHEIDAGHLPGPHLDVTGPYLEGADSYFIQMHQLSSPEEARQFVDYWADRGVTSFKAHMNLTRAELKAAIDEAHKRNIGAPVCGDLQGSGGVGDRRLGAWLFREHAT